MGNGLHRSGNGSHQVENDTHHLGNGLHQVGSASPRVGITSPELGNDLLLLGTPLQRFGQVKKCFELKGQYVKYLLISEIWHRFCFGYYTRVMSIQKMFYLF